MTTDKMSYKLRNNEWIKVLGKYKYCDSTAKANNLKKIICKNIITNGSCVYGNKCLYAHTLDDQNVDKIRKIAYDIIRQKTDCKNVNILTNRQLYETFKILSNVCEQCEMNKCTGGYNCKHGACKNEYAICLSDMNKGVCNKTCNKIHLTDLGLIPYGMQLATTKRNNIDILVPFNIANGDNKNEKQIYANEPTNDSIRGVKSIFRVELDKIEINAL